ncbi:MAG: redoxin domain-containing protein [Planctomycetes bacterium]|nr:redoxin domain-containing protein [Planctomycetota bacterium]
MRIVLNCLIVLSLCFSLSAYAAESLKVGMAIPHFELQDQDGATQTSESFFGKALVIYWYNDKCVYVNRHFAEGTLNDLSKKYADKKVTFLAVDSSHFATVEGNLVAKTKRGYSFSILDDHTATTAKKFEATVTPEVFITDAKGILLYRGAIDNNPLGDKNGDKRINYVQKTLDEHLAGKVISITSKKPYGCGIKLKPKE